MDQYEVTGIRAKLETMAAKIFEEKIDEGSIREVFEKINARYTDKRAADVFKEIKDLFGKCYMVAFNMEKEAKGAERLPSDSQDKRKRSPFNRKSREY